MTKAILPFGTDVFDDSEIGLTPIFKLSHLVQILSLYFQTIYYSTSFS